MANTKTDMADTNIQFGDTDTSVLANYVGNQYIGPTLDNQKLR